MKRFLKSALAALPLVMLASCAADDIVVDDGIAKKSETRYLQVTLSSANGTPETRAIGNLDATDGKYDTGTPEENAIKTLDFYFYDSQKQYHSYVPMAISDDGTALNPTPIEDAEHPNLSGYYHCNVPVELIQGEKYPQYVICIINSYQGSTYRDLPMVDAQTRILESIYSNAEGETQYFGMSNSVYYGQDEVTGENGVLIMATPFKTEMLKTETELAAMSETEIEDYTINIHVERYAAKVNLDLSGTSVTPYASGDNAVTLTFEPKKWAVNAVERSFFFLKAFRRPAASTTGTNTPTGVGVDFATMSEMDDILFTGWNNEAHHRCFWARTPGYYANEYPLVADDIVTSTDKPTGQYNLSYFNYTQCENLDGTNQYHQYVMETTMKQSRLTGADMGDQYLPLASIPSVILVGQYKVGGRTDYIDFYTYGKQNDKFLVYSGETNEITGTRKIIDKMLDDQSIIVYLNESGVYTPVGSAYAAATDVSADKKVRSQFTVEHPSPQVRSTSIGIAEGLAENGGIRVAADVVVLQITEPNEKLYFYNTVNQKYEPITSGYLNTVNRLLLQNLGGAHFYKDGMAFFSAPIQHWGWYRADNENAQPKGDGTAKTIDDWDWTKMKTGDFGVVRNHVYSLKIGKIEGLGTGIKNPDEPIVPPADKVGYKVHFHVNIQKWAVLPTQNWNF